MSNPPTVPDQAIARLVDEGYDLVLQQGHLVVRRIVYRSPNGPRRDGILLIPVSYSDGLVTDAGDHTMWFAGDEPLDENQAPLGSVGAHDYGVGEQAKYMLSFKPHGDRYPSVYDKVRHYARVLARGDDLEGLAADPRQGAFQVVPDDLPLVYPDTNATRVGLITLNTLFRGQRVAIVGIGGTGSYILDQVAKTWVDQIILIDGDELEPHNAYRAPGAASRDAVFSHRNKAEYFADEYARMHTGIVARPVALTADNLHLLDGSTFVFLAAADAEARPYIMRHLRERDIPFIDVGMSFREGDSGLTGLAKVSTYLPGDLAALPTAPAVAPEEDDYRSNIQIADLNAMNALLAVIRWKRHLGFYATHEASNVTVFKLYLNEIRNGDLHVAD
ncbi:ThiF family adenylyltransferase [Antiquaquibacter soli]|uniref:ThiF family adenylyltransferase n=1 Tax=Antiquaquibacter soli TaxID=3064523 RepID=A0ABT9BR65_9MICO|nr:ThiF family adenylyltransferase [Protaetiibacter sp. WY-16]MDO7883119.1 ThiF family adenylyltransferase [Protaetiibacter sp. WY-16]